MTVGEKIKYRRKVIGITQQRLAELTGIHPVTIRKYEINKLVPGPEQLSKIADALSISYNALSGDDSFKYRFETEGDIAGALISFCKDGIVIFTGERDEESYLTDDSFRVVIGEKFAKFFRIDFTENDVRKEKKSDQVAVRIASWSIRQALIKWEHNLYIYNQAMEKFGEDADPEIQKRLLQFKDMIEQAELSFQNIPYLLDSGIRINPNY